MEDEWVEEHELEMLDRAKLVSLRIVTHRVLGYARSDDYVPIVTPILELLNRIINLDGQISGTSRTNEGFVYLLLYMLRTDETERTHEYNYVIDLRHV
jgi:hypothetical protein